MTGNGLTRKLHKLGGSTAVVIPSDFASFFNLEAGKTVKIGIEKGKLIITPASPPAKDAEAGAAETPQEGRPRT